MDVMIGVDVSKAKLDCLWLKDLQTLKVKTKVLANTVDGYEALINWVLKNTGVKLSDCRFVMEATGIYHEALAYYLYEAGAKVYVVNPARVRDFARSLGTRSKTDKKDSMMLARFGAVNPLRLWQPEAPEIRTLRALLARLDALEKDIQREKNRLEKAEISQASAQVIESIQLMLSALNQGKRRLEQQINDHIDRHPKLKQDRKLLESIPGVGPVLSRVMMAVIRSRNFDNARQCAAYLGLNPIPWESGSSVKAPPRMSKAGPALVRAKLYMGAIVASQWNPDVKTHRERMLARGKSKMSALGAAMRKLVHICFGVLKQQVKYIPQAA
ncbi:IS110 family transposase [Pontibacterium sp.]|uniref:IS110 family transposase n=1 Tax=Pontibacterium sp. TaxID=2036026 RepID=UPI0035182ECB